MSVSRRWIALAAPFAFALMGSGCASLSAGGPEADSGVAHLATSSIAVEPRLTAFTTRNAVANAVSRPWFGTERAQRPTVAELRLRPPPASGIFSLAGGDWRIESVQVLPQGLQWSETGVRRDVLIYVHGFNTTFETAALDAARLSNGVGFHGETIVFTWPSRAALLDYIYDRESAMWSRDVFETMLEELMDHPAVGTVHLVAHSMGTMLTVEALRQFHAQRGEGGARKIGAVVLASPDIDIDVFTNSVRRIGRLADKITVLTSTRDRALGILTRVAGGVTRVGSAEKEKLEAMGLRVIDASEHSGQGVNHDLFLSSPEVRHLVRRAIEEQEPLPVIGRSEAPGAPLRP